MLVHKYYILLPYCSGIYGCYATMDIEVKTWVCPKCGKQISSIYPRQLEQNKKAHLDSHET